MSPLAIAEAEAATEIREVFSEQQRVDHALAASPTTLESRRQLTARDQVGDWLVNVVGAPPEAVTLYCDALEAIGGCTGAGFG